MHKFCHNFLARFFRRQCKSVCLPFYLWTHSYDAPTVPQRSDCLRTSASADCNAKTVIRIIVNWLLAVVIAAKYLHALGFAILALLVCMLPRYMVINGDSEYCVFLKNRFYFLFLNCCFYYVSNRLPLELETNVSLSVFLGSHSCVCSSLSFMREQSYADSTYCRLWALLPHASSYTPTLGDVSIFQAM